LYKNHINLLLTIEMIYQEINSYFIFF